ncbi:MAG: ShlB/FhaC/HecB family hemolysin secretion/activation protein, partial [Pseudomonadales bacterium]|nr:ShlB/FhaC/HecB family hemolysin secretion/activation protein [Pseudomonadales bacterium]
LTEQLRGSGLLLAKAILPAQEIESGAVLIRVFVGKFGAVDSEANVLYNKTTIQQPFESAIGDAVKVDFVESTILRLSDMPGFTAAAVFKPGNALGETRLTVKAVEEAPVSYFAQADNFGVESTGDARLLLGVKVNNVTGHIDQLSVDALKTFSPGDLRNARLAYEITHPDLVHTLGLGFSKTSYDVEDEAVLVLGIEGDTEIGEIFLRSQWVRQRNINVATRIGLALKRSNVDFTTFNVEQGVDRLTVFEATVVADALDTRFRGVHRASLTFSHGFNGLLGSMDGQGNGESLGIVNGEQTLPGQFNKISASYSRLQSVVRNNSLLFHFNGQYSDDLLSSLERMSLGGPYTVRAYPVAEYVRDTAVFTSLAWVINGGVFSDGIAYGEYGWSDILSLSVFADYGWGKLKDGSGGPTSTIDIAGWGVEAELSFPNFGGFTRLSAAKPFDGSEALNGEDIQYWLSFGLNL